MISAILHHIGLGLRLNLRNPMAMIYGYLFPLIFLVAFWAIYRADRVPIGSADGLNFAAFGARNEVAIFRTCEANSERSS